MLLCKRINKYLYQIHNMYLENKQINKYLFSFWKMYVSHSYNVKLNSSRRFHWFQSCCGRQFFWFSSFKLFPFFFLFFFLKSHLVPSPMVFCPLLVHAQTHCMVRLMHEVPKIIDKHIRCQSAVVNNKASFKVNEKCVHVCRMGIWNR